MLGALRLASMRQAAMQLQLVLLTERLRASLYDRLLAFRRLRRLRALVGLASVMPQCVQQKSGLGVIRQHHATVASSAHFTA